MSNNSSDDFLLKYSRSKSYAKKLEAKPKQTEKQRVLTRAPSQPAASQVAPPAAVNKFEQPPVHNQSEVSNKPTPPTVLTQPSKVGQMESSQPDRKQPNRIAENKPLKLMLRPKRVQKDPPPVETGISQPVAVVAPVPAPSPTPVERANAAVQIHVRPPTPPPKLATQTDWGEKPRRDSENHHCESEHKKETEQNFLDWVRNGRDNDMQRGKVILFPGTYRPEFDDYSPAPTRRIHHSRSVSDIRRPSSVRSNQRALSENKRPKTGSASVSKKQPSKKDNDNDILSSVEAVLNDARK